MKLDSSHLFEFQNYPSKTYLNKNCVWFFETPQMPFYVQPENENNLITGIKDTIPIINQVFIKTVSKHLESEEKSNFFYFFENC